MHLLQLRKLERRKEVKQALKQLETALNNFCGERSLDDLYPYLPQIEEVERALVRVRRGHGYVPN